MTEMKSETLDLEVYLETRQGGLMDLDTVHIPIFLPLLMEDLMRNLKTNYIDKSLLSRHIGSWKKSPMSKKKCGEPE